MSGNQIQFINTDKKIMFSILSGERIILTHKDGCTEVLPCEKLSNRYVKIGGYVYDHYGFARQLAKREITIAPIKCAG